MLADWLAPNHERVHVDRYFFAVLSAEIPDNHVAICRARKPIRMLDDFGSQPQCMLIKIGDAGWTLQGLEAGDWERMEGRATRWKPSLDLGRQDNSSILARDFTIPGDSTPSFALFVISEISNVVRNPRTLLSVAKVFD